MSSAKEHGIVAGVFVLGAISLIMIYAVMSTMFDMKYSKYYPKDGKKARWDRTHSKDTDLNLNGKDVNWGSNCASGNCRPVLGNYNEE